MGHPTAVLAHQLASAYKKDTPWFFWSPLRIGLGDCQLPENLIYPTTLTNSIAIDQYELR